MGFRGLGYVTFQCQSPRPATRWDYFLKDEDRRHFLDSWPLCRGDGRERESRGGREAGRERGRERATQKHDMVLDRQRLWIENLGQLHQQSSSLQDVACRRPRHVLVPFWSGYVEIA